MRPPLLKCVRPAEWQHLTVRDRATSALCLTSLAGAGGEVLVSSTVKDLVAGSGLRFGDRGNQTLKGVPDEWHVYAVNA